MESVKTVINIRRLSALLVAMCLSASSQPTSAQPIDERWQTKIDWSQFLAPLDLHWSVLPKSWDEGAFTGNGRLGAMMHLSEDGKSFVIKVNRGDVQDHRRELGALNGLCRLPIGRFHIRPAGTFTGCRLRLDLWNAELQGELFTSQGRIEIHQYTHAVWPVIVLTVRRSDGEAAARLDWEPYAAISPRQVYARSSAKNRGKLSSEYTDNAPPRVVLDPDGGRSVQDLQHGWQTATVWRRRESGTSSQLLVTVGHEEIPRSAVADAQSIVDGLATHDEAELSESHRRWWHAFYPRSCLSVPDPYWQAFYWIQLYKLASTTRADGMLVDTCGIWLEHDTLWPLAWWNLNVQLTYWAALASNHPDLVRSLTEALDRNGAVLQANATRDNRPERAAIGRVSDQHCDSIDPGPELSNLTWALHNYWLLYRHTMDEAMLRERLYPLLKQSLRQALDVLKTGDDGLLHTPKRTSPEYLSAADTNYDLALIRWGLTTLIETADRLQVDTVERTEWRDALRHLTDYPKDETGYQVAAGRPLMHGHRHYSHLLMIYPLYLVHREQPENVPLIRRSLEHWQSFQKGKEGYSMTGAASMAAALGDGDEALVYLDGLKPFLRPNTMYKETGPVVETPLSGAQSILDMLLQSWGDKIRVLPAVPARWSTVSFHDLSAEGGFLVSAVRVGGRTKTVRVKSLAGRRCRIETDLPRPFHVVGPGAIRDDGHLVEADLAQGQELILYLDDQPLAPVPVDPKGPAHTFGMPVAQPISERDSRAHEARK